MAITDVPVSPLSTEVLIRHGATQFTLTLLLLHHLKGDLREFRGRGVDAVGIELDFVHVLIIGAKGAKSRRGGTDVDPSQRRSIRLDRPEPI